MALDFAQIDGSGQVTGRTVRIGADLHHLVIQTVPGERFPLLSRMSDYYEDAPYRADELVALESELNDYAQIVADPLHKGLLDSMSGVVRDSIVQGFVVEAIAD